MNQGAKHGQVKQGTGWQNISGLIAIVAFFAAYAIYYWPELACYCGRSGDFALIELEVEKAKHFAALLGPYSRYHFNHPGPIYFYTLAAIGSLLPGIECPTSFAQLIINCVFLTWTTYLLGALGVPRFRIFLMVAIFVMACLLGRDDFLHFIWNPAAIVFPAFLFFIASAGVLSGRRDFLLPQLLSFSFAVQTHLGALPVLGSILTVSWAVYLRRRPQAPGELRHWLILALVTFLLFSAPLYEFVTNPQSSNLYRILNFGAQATAEHSLTESIQYIARFYLSPLRLRVSPYTILMPVFFLIAIMSKHFEKGSWERHFRLVWILGTLASIAAATRISGRQYHYLIWYQNGLVAIFYGLVISSLPNKILTGINGCKGIKPLTIAAGCLALLFLTLQNPPEVKSCKATPELNLPLEHDTLYRLHFSERRYWPNVAFYALKLYRAGIPICISEEWAFMFGRDLICKDTTGASSTKSRVLSIGGEEAPPGFTKLRPGLYLSESKS